MISRTGNKGFFAAHYDWVAAGVGLLALVAGGAFFALTLGDDPDAAAQEERENLAHMKPNATGVKPVDMTTYLAVSRLMRTPATVTEVPAGAASFLASERRVVCKGAPGKPCGKAIPGDVKACPVCPFCGAKQEEEKKVVLDADGDGIPDEWEKKHGLNPGDAADANADSDGDGFTNLEEFLAKTDPTNAKDHPPYLDSLSIVLPLKETKMPFYLQSAIKARDGWKCTFIDPAKVNDYGQRGLRLTAFVGKEIASDDGKVKPGFVLKSYTQKTEKRSINIKGMEGMKKDIDVSEAVVVRQRDGKSVTLRVAQGKKPSLEPVDVQATLKYERGDVKNFDVVPGSEIDLNGEKYRVVTVQHAGKGAKVTLENVLTAKKHVLEALEQDGK